MSDDRRRYDSRRRSRSRSPSRYRDRDRNGDRDRDRRSSNYRNERKGFNESTGSRSHDRSDYRNNDKYRREEDYRKDRSKQASYDRTNDRNNHHSHSSDSRDYPRNQRDDKYSSYNSNNVDEKWNRNDEHRKVQRSSNSHHKRATSTSSSHGSSPYSTPPPPPSKHPPNHIPPIAQPTIQNNYSSYRENKIKYESSRETIDTKKISDPRKTTMSQNHKIQKAEEKKHNFKVLIDPTIKKGHTKIVRYDGVLAGQAPVVPKDPRRPKSKIWSIEVGDLPVPKLKIDKNYVGPMIMDTVRFSNLNNNVDRKFLHELCEAYGDIKEYKVYFDPKTNSHLGTGKVVFDEGTSVVNVVMALNGRQVMGKTITVYIEMKNPPGHAMLKQLEAECVKYRYPTIRDANVMNLSATHSTPITPSISSMNRAQPVAGSLQDYSYDIEPPPPPPPKLNDLKYHSKSRSTPPPPPPKLKFDEISPTASELDQRFWQNHNMKNLPANETKSNRQSGNNIAQTLMRVAGYSSNNYSNKNLSPRSPAIRDKKERTSNYTKFESVSDNEHGAVEDISPVSPSRRTAPPDDDDAMSLSSISSNGDTKVELNIQSNINNFQNRHLNSINSLQHKNQIPPNNILSQTSHYSQSPYLLNQYQQPQQHSQQHPTNVLSPQSDKNTHGRNSSNFNTTNHVHWSNRHTEIIKNALQQSVGNATFQPQLPAGVNNLSFQTQSVRPSVQNQLSSQSPGMQTPLTDEPQAINMFPQDHSQQIPLPQNVPIISPEQQIEFQVKTGCARDLSQELKRILVKDTLKKLIEHTAFNSFEKWWQNQHQTENKSLYKNISTKISEKVDKTLSDKSNIDTSQKLIKPEAPLTTSALLKTLFAHDRDNENQPPPATSFLNSFRISRKPQLKPAMMVKGKQISHKRKPWPSFHKKLKHRRIEDSEDEDEDMSDVEEGEKKIESDEEQFEEFALRHRHARQSGSSLYQQRVYSDESEDDDKPRSEDESSSESSSSEDESSTTESETTEEESETEEEIIEDEKVDESLKKSTEDGLSKQDVISTKKSLEIQKDPEVQSVVPDEKEKKIGKFVSMYDEPRRRAAVRKVEIEREKQKQKQIEEKRKQKSKSTIRRTRKIQQISESSSTESSSSADENEYIDALLNEKNITIDETKKQKVNQDNEIIKTETNDEIMFRLIMLDHNYSRKQPKTPIKEHRKTLHEKQFNEQTFDDDDEYLDVEKVTKFSLRNKIEENNILNDFYIQGLDIEDYGLMKEAYERLKEKESKEVDELIWLDHPISSDISPHKQKRHKSEPKLRVHNTGCARTEGYYKIPMVEKATYLKSALRQLNTKKEAEIAQKTKSGDVHKVKSRENRAMQRRLASSIAHEVYGSLLSYNNQLQIRKKALRFAKSSIHNWGLFACEPIAAEEMVCEYLGQMVRAVVAEIREKRYEKMGIGSSYLFRLDMESVIDATKHGCNARFINHCCDPNCYAKVILVEGAKKIVIYSRRDIKLNEEITYDYKFPIEDEKIPCLCGAATCRGSLN